MTVFNVLTGSRNNTSGQQPKKGNKRNLPEGADWRKAPVEEGGILGGGGNYATDHPGREGRFPEEGGVEDEFPVADGESPDVEDLSIPGFDLELSAAGGLGFAKNDGIDRGGGTEFA
jgi:hypothetical protein